MNLVPARLPLQEVEVLLTPATIKTLSLMLFRAPIYTDQLPALPHAWGHALPL